MKAGEAESAPPAASYKWRVVAMLWFICFFNYADRQSIFSIFPRLKGEFGFDKVQLGLIGSAFMWVYAGGAPFAGFICDRVRRKDLILGGCVFWSIITVMTGWCHRLWQFIVVRGLEGLGETFYFPASMSLLSDYHSARTRSRALSFHQSSVYIGTIAGSWLGAWCAEEFGWRMTFYFFGALGFLLALFLFRRLREPKRGESGTLVTAAALSAAKTGPSFSIRQTLRLLLRNPAVPLLMLGFLAANFVATIFLTWTPTFLVEKFHFKLAAAGFSGSVFIHLASAASVPLAGWLADKLASYQRGGRIIIQALGLVVGAAFVVFVGKTSSIAVLLFAMTGFGFCKGFYDSGIFASLFDLIDPRARGAAAGIMNTVGWGGGALGPLFVGVASKYGGKPTEIQNMSDAIAFGGVIYLLGAGLLLLAFLFSRKRGGPSSFLGTANLSNRS